MKEKKSSRAEQKPKCPECGCTDIEREEREEYTGGGYADRWEVFVCEECGHEWRSGTRSGYA